MSAAVPPAHPVRLPQPQATAPVHDIQRTPRHADPALRQDTARLGMWIFLAGEVLFFGTVLFVYAIARWHNPAGFAAASAQTDVVLGTLNTALLLVSSCAMAIGAEASECQRPRAVAPCLWLAAALGLAFLAIKGVEYRREWGAGLFPGPGFSVAGREVPGAELFFAWYFFATALHALHLFIGIVFCAGFALASRSRHAASAGAPRIQMLALYWHFVDVVWIVLYPLIYLVAPRS
jgi:cytochrome c oxidase subunit 3